MYRAPCRNAGTNPLPLPRPMRTTPSLTALFNAIDARDAGTFADFLADDVVFGFGNARRVTGRAAVKTVVEGFFDSIAGLRHEIRESWEQDDALICHGVVTYRRKDGRELTVPFANVLRCRGGRIGEYLVFADTSQLYVPA